MITALLAVAFIWCLLYGHIALLPLAILCLGVGIAFVVAKKHGHSHFSNIDTLARASRLARVNPLLKFCTAISLMGIGLSSQSPLMGIFLASMAFVLIVFVGGLKTGDYLHLISLPLSFLMISGLAILFEVSAKGSGLINFNIFGIYFSVSLETQARATLVITRAVGALSCLFLLSLTTPMPNLIGMLRRVHCPKVLIDLMYLIYRYIFILLSMYQIMCSAAKSRLGYANYQTSIRTTGRLYSNLLARSLRQASINFDAMESRCYDAGIRFLEKRTKITPLQVIAATVMVLSAFLMRLCLA